MLYNISIKYEKLTNNIKFLGILTKEAKKNIQTKDRKV